MNIVNIVWAAAIMLILGGIFALLLAFLANKLQVVRDERIDLVAKKLSGANCGGCGYAGCDAFATAIVEGKAKISDCPSTSKESKQEILLILGANEDLAEETIAVVCCNGGNSCKDKYEYQGYGDCKSCELLAGGRKACAVGCMGMSSCVDVCAYFAIEVGEDGYARVNREKCTSCGQCIKACPKLLISRIPKSAAVYVACSNDCKGKDVRSICDRGCIGCGLCQKNCPTGAITIVNNLPKFDYSKCTKCGICADKCPTKVIKKV